MSENENRYGGLGGQISGGVNYDATTKTPDARPQPGNPAPSTNPESLLNVGNSAPLEVRDITTAEFRDQVISASANTPVLVDFWAPWCGPCKQLAPALERAVARTAGKVKLVKMNIDDHPEVAGQMGIQSIPAVVAFVDGQPKDAFMGNKSESEIDRFVEKLVGPSGPSPLEEALGQAEELLNSDLPDQAAQIYGAILAQQPENPDALAGYGMSMLKQGNVEAADEVAAQAAGSTGHAGLDAFTTALALKKQAGDIGDVSELTANVAANPADHAARFDLAIALNGLNRREEAADHLLEIIAKDRNWREDGAKAQLLQFFEAWGPADPVTLSARRRLSSLLFS